MDYDKKQLSSIFSQRFTRAWKALKERRVKKYIFKPSKRVVWIVVGKECDYLVMSVADFCSCDDFYFRGMGKEIRLCYHLIAQKLAETLKQCEVIEERDIIYVSNPNGISGNAQRIFVKIRLLEN